MIPLGWVTAEVAAALARLGAEGEPVVEPARAGHGELTVKAALGRPDLAARLAADLSGRAEIAAAQAAGPGFVNLTMTPGFWHSVLAGMLEHGFAAVAVVPVALSADMVFSVQYAHARCHSVLRHAGEIWPEVVTSGGALARAPLARLTGAAELGLIRLLAEWPRAMDAARIAGFLAEVAAGFDAWWNEDRGEMRLRLLDAGDFDASLARLALVRAVASALAAGLESMGIQPMEEMR